MRRLVLFDIDGTIMNVHGAGSRALLAALEAVFERPISVDGYSMSGKTDTQIVLELLERHGCPAGEVLPRLPQVWDSYLAGFSAVIGTVNPHVYAGIPELLMALAERDDAVVGLLTGNVERAAWLKLRRVDLDEHFCLGAFGDAAPQRCLLPDIAIKEALRIVGRRFEGPEIVIIGDTPNDIDCGRHLDVRSIAVATGRFSQDELAAHNPAYCFADLSDTGGCLAAIYA